MDISDVKAMAHLIVEQEILKETQQGEYDVQASINAARRFANICESIDADSVEAFLRELELRIAQARGRMGKHARGEYNGGLGTLGSCQRQLIAAVEVGLTPAKLSKQLQPKQAMPLHRIWLIGLGMFIALLLILNKR